MSAEWFVVVCVVAVLVGVYWLGWSDRGREEKWRELERRLARLAKREVDPNRAPQPDPRAQGAEVITRKEFDNADSNGALECPDCGRRNTHPRPGCWCPPNPNGYGTRHINAYHHTCPAEPKEPDSAQAPEKEGA